MNDTWDHRRVRRELKLDEMRARRGGFLLLMLDATGRLMTIDEFLSAHSDADDDAWWGFERKETRPTLGPWVVKRYHRATMADRYESDLLGEEWVLDSQGHHVERG